jgi:hypothetical protein
LTSLAGELLLTRDEILSDPATISQFISAFIRKLKVSSADQLVQYLTQCAIQSSTTCAWALPTFYSQASLFRLLGPSNHSFDLVLPRITLRTNIDTADQLNCEEESLLVQLISCITPSVVSKKPTFGTFLSAIQGGKSKSDTAVRAAALQQLSPSLLEAMSASQCKQIFSSLVELHTNYVLEESAVSTEVSTVILSLPLQSSLFVDFLVFIPPPLVQAFSFFSSLVIFFLSPILVCLIQALFSSCYFNHI